MEYHLKTNLCLLRSTVTLDIPSAILPSCIHSQTAKTYGGTGSASASRICMYSTEHEN